MFKSLTLILLVISSLFAVPGAYSTHQICQPGYIDTIDPETGFTKCVFEDEIEKEVPLVPELQYPDYREFIEMTVNTMEGSTEISSKLMSRNSQDILIPYNLETAILNSERLRVLIFTNEWKCAPGIAADPCVLVQIEREGLGEFTETIQKNTREITDQILFHSQFIGLHTEFHSIII